MEATVRMRKPLRRSLSYTAGSRFIKSFNQGTVPVFAYAYDL